MTFIIYLKNTYGGMLAIWCSHLVINTAKHYINGSSLIIYIRNDIKYVQRNDLLTQIVKIICFLQFNHSRTSILISSLGIESDPLDSFKQ